MLSQSSSREGGLLSDHGVTITGAAIGFLLLTAFNRITGIDPGVKTAQDGVDVRKAIL
jgi:hypothetical protein